MAQSPIIPGYGNARPFSLRVVQAHLQLGQRRTFDPWPPELPWPPTLENYSALLVDYDFPLYAANSLIVAGGTVRESILSPGVRIDSGSLVEGSVLMHDVHVGEGAIVRRAILDKNVWVPPGARIGVDPEQDRALGLTLSDNGIVVVGKGDNLRALR